jgi:hypothetical protein
VQCNRRWHLGHGGQWRRPGPLQECHRQLTVLATGGNLHIYNVSGCFGLINSGDTATFGGSYQITPKQVITSP